MPPARNAVERGLEQLCSDWLQATSTDPCPNLFVWRHRSSAERMLDVFLEAQSQPGQWSAPDMFLLLNDDFETSFGFSRAIKESLLLGYGESRARFVGDGAEAWIAPNQENPDTARGALALFADFLAHHQSFFRHLVLVIRPQRVVSPEALQQWVEEAALASPLPSALKICLVDSEENQKWQPLVDRHGAKVDLIKSKVDMFDIARDLACQSGGAGPVVTYRTLVADLMTLLEKSPAAEFSTRSERAMRIASRQNWHDQQALLHMMAAGAWLKEQKYAESIARYRLALCSATAAREAAHPAGTNLVTQVWMSEAGAWLAANQFDKAALAYRTASREARSIPHLMFEIEGLRMAAFCESRMHRGEEARKHLLQAVVIAKSSAESDLPATTFPFVLQELLQLQDKARAEKLQRLAELYQQELTIAHHEAEARASRLGPAPTRSDLAQIDLALLDRCEAAHAKVLREREALIASADEFFRKVVAVGRDLLNPGWSGLPEIPHPTDKDPPQWDTPPSYAVAPDSQALDTHLSEPAPNSGLSKEALA